MADDTKKANERGGSASALRQLQKQSKKSAQRDRSNPASKLAHGPSRWQRGVRYVWDKNRGRG